MNDIAEIITACGGVATVVITAAGGFYLQLKSLKLQQAQSAKIDETRAEVGAKVDANTEVTEKARLEVLFGQTQAINIVKEAKQASVANSQALSLVSNKIDKVAESATASVDRISEAQRARGVAEGHLAGVAAEQARVLTLVSTGEMRGLGHD